MRTFCFYILILLSFAVRSQTYSDDAAIWIGVGGEKKLGDLDINVNFKSRISENVSQYGLGYVDIGLSYNCSEWLKFTVGYKYGKARQLDGSYNNRQRPYLALLLKKKFGQFGIVYRNLLQMRLTD